MKLKKKSAWKYGASAGADIGLFMASFSKGFFEVERKNGVRSEGSRLHYTAAGAGVGRGMPISVSFSTTDKEFVSVGDIYVSDNVRSDDLQISDFEGLCFIHSVSANFGTGAS